MITGFNGSSLIKGDGEMAGLTREKDWSKSPVGEISKWPHALLTTVNIILNSKFPMFLWWGDDMIQFYNDAYRPSMGNDGKHPTALGQKAVDCWQEIWAIIYPLIQSVKDSGQPTWNEDQLIPIYRNGKMEDVYWTFCYSAVYNEDGKIAGILVTCMETTEKIINHNASLEARNALQLAHTETKQQRDMLKQFFMEAPAGICILSGPEFIFELANPLYQQLIGRNDLLGKPLFTILPQLKGQPVEAILNNVYHNNEFFEGHDLNIPIPDKDTGILKDRYFNFIYQPRHDANNEVNGVLVFVYEVTEIANTKKALQESEYKFRNIVEQSPVPIMVTRGGEMIIEECNEPMLQLIGQKASIKGHSIYDAMPELVGQPVIDHLKHCFLHGEKWEGHEQRILLVKDGVEVPGYYNITYQPFIEKGRIAGVLHSAIDVTEQVLARKKLEKTEDTLKLSLLAANLGTFDVDMENDILTWDKRCRTLFGISHDNEVSYQKDFEGGLHPDDKERILSIINNEVFNKALSNGNYDVEYRTIGAEDNKVRWVRAMGKAYFNERDQPIRFIGSVLDITEQKEDEMRKNDFIGMVSHELKTPLTSLKAYMQILQSGTYQQLAPTVLPKTEVQVNKMNNLINGFLNLSRFESGKLTLEKQSFDLQKLIEEILSDKRLIAPHHTILFEKCQIENVVADREKIESVIRNLLSNAIKYSAVNTNITVTCMQLQDSVEVRVKDEGIGIKKEDIENIFQRYYRVENQTTKTISGFGIGLYLSAEIIKRHNGTIGAESTTGQSSVFYFTLPLE